MHCRVPLNYSINTEKVSHRPLYVSGMDCYYKLNKKSDFLLCMSLYKMKASPASFIGNQRVVTKEVLPVASLSCRAPLCCSSWERSQSSLLPWSILARGKYWTFFNSGLFKVNTFLLSIVPGSEPWSISSRFKYLLKVLNCSMKMLPF